MQDSCRSEVFYIESQTNQVFVRPNQERILALPAPEYEDRYLSLNRWVLSPV
jgi:hypothetical protein